MNMYEFLLEQILVDENLLVLAAHLLYQIIDMTMPQVIS